MTLRTIEKMVAQVSDSPMISAAQLALGYANQVYLVGLRDGRRLVVRVLDNQSPEGARNERLLQDSLVAGGIITSRFLPVDGDDVVGCIEDLSFTVSDYIEGSVPTDVTDDLARSFGATLARFHVAVDSVDYSHRDWLDRDNALSNVARSSSAYRTELEALIGEAEPLFTSGLPVALIHGDLRPENTFADGDAVTAVFDFETAERNVRLLDLARTALGLAGEDSSAVEPMFGLVVEGYESVASVTDDEKAMGRLALRYVAGACAAWFLASGMDKFGHEFLAMGRAIPGRAI